MRRGYKDGVRSYAQWFDIEILRCAVLRRRDMVNSKRAQPVSPPGVGLDYPAAALAASLRPLHLVG